MNCTYHPNQAAHFICQKCKNPLCQECTIQVEDKTICRHCLEQSLNLNFNTLPGPQVINGPRKSFWEKLLFFFYSLIPGAAHMHLGLFRRGLQLMIIIFGGSALINFIGLDFLIPFIVIPTWFYSFFESHHLRKQLEKGDLIVDHDLFDRHLFDYTPLLKNRRLIGVLIIVIGLLSLVRHLDRSSILNRLFGNWDYYYFFRGSLIPLCFILGGIYLIFKATKSKPSEEITSKSPSSDFSENQ